MSIGERIDHPEHYQRGGKETIYAIRDALSHEAFCGFIAGNIVKYVARFQYKGGIEDLQKAQWYIDFLISEIQKIQEGKSGRD